MNLIKMFTLIIAATIVEAVGDATIRKALLPADYPLRIALYLAGIVLLAIYGTLLNLAPIDFGTATGVYIASLFVCFQITNYLFFGASPHAATIIGGCLIIAGGVIVYVWR